ncbi:hypothetical protein MTO96_039664 [Rhipicephalus appendiculatus]
MSRSGRKEQRILLFAAIAFVVFETTSAWPHASYGCGRNQQARCGSKANTYEAHCGSDAMNANQRRPSQCRPRAGLTCVCFLGFYRKKPGGCHPCVRIDMCN